MGNMIRVSETIEQLRFWLYLLLGTGKGQIKHGPEREVHKYALAETLEHPYSKYQPMAATSKCRIL